MAKRKFKVGDIVEMDYGADKADNPMFVGSTMICRVTRLCRTLYELEMLGCKHPKVGLVTMPPAKARTYEKNLRAVTNAELVGLKLTEVSPDAVDWKNDA